MAGPARALTVAERTAFGWLDHPGTFAITDALEKEALGSARFVGGCVRDGLVGISAADIDLATPLPPDVVLEALGKAKIRAIPTGIDHGTITAVSHGQVIEVTTLRKDVATDGRRAVVEFTTDWAADARRRDFTINALYLDLADHVYDPVGGLDDLAARKVRFIGNPEARIREDYLRILRFFRFSARFATTYDRDGLGAIAACQDGFDGLSRERIGQEIIKLFGLTRLPDAARHMTETGILGRVWPKQPDLETLVAWRAIIPQGDPFGGLVALFNGSVAGLGQRLRLSNADTERLDQIAAVSDGLEARPDHDALAALAYRSGKPCARSALAVACARLRTEPTLARGLLAQLDALPTHSFPVRGGDLVARNVAPGPAIADMLAALEGWWIAAGFPDREETLAELDRRLAGPA